jgi:anti-anti-sigma factor
MIRAGTDMMQNREGDGGRVVVSPEGRLDSVTVMNFRALLDQAVKTGNRRIVVDLSHVGYITSAGLGVIIRAAREAKASGGQLVICGPVGCVRDVLDISGLTRIIPTTATLEEAMKE